MNRKLFPSVQLQAVCDAKGKFLNTRDALYPPQGYFIVGDGGYPCISHPVAIITPYREPLQGRVQSRYNQHHAKARSIIERAFGMMKTRWRSLLFRALEVNHTFAPTVITACAVLHNICLTAGDILEPVQDSNDPPVPPPRPVRGERSGSVWRDRLAGQLSAPPLQMAALQDHNY